MTLEIFDFWLELTLLALAACLLVFGIFDTRLQAARRKGVDAVALLRRNSRRLWVLIAGTTVILVGIIISPLPGPGFTVLGPIGLAILASEFVWARRLTVQIRERTGPLRDATQRVANSTPRWTVIPLCLAYWCVAGVLLMWEPVPAAVLWPATSIMFSPMLLWGYMVLRSARV